MENPLDSSSAWRFFARKGLHAHDVPSVEAFGKAIAEAERKLRNLDISEARDSNNLSRFTALNRMV